MHNTLSIAWSTACTCLFIDRRAAHPQLIPSLWHIGAIAACFVGAATLTTSLRIGLALLAFYYTSSKLTAYKEEVKDVAEEFKKGGQRDWRQVLLSCSELCMHVNGALTIVSS